MCVYNTAVCAQSLPTFFLWSVTHYILHYLTPLLIFNMQTFFHFSSSTCHYCSLFICVFQHKKPRTIFMIIDLKLIQAHTLSSAEMHQNCIIYTASFSTGTRVNVVIVLDLHFNACFISMSSWKTASVRSKLLLCCMHLHD